MSHVLCESEDRYGESGGDADDAYQRGVPTPRNHSHYTSNNNNSNTNKNEAHDDDDDDESTSSWESFDEDEGNIDGGDTAAPHHHLHGDVDELYEDDNDDDDDIVDGVAEEEEEYEEDDDDDAEWSSLSSGEVQIADPPTKPSQQAQTSSPRVAQPQTAAAPDAHTSSGAAAAGNTTLSELLEDDVDADTIFILELALQLYLTEEGIHLRNIHSCLARLSLQAPPGFDVKSYFAAGSGEQSPTHIPPNMLLQPELWLHLVQDLLRLTGNPLNGEGLRRDHSSTLMSDGQTHASTLQPNERTNTTAPDDGHSELTDGGVGGGAGAATTPRDAAHRAFLAAYQRDLSNSARHHEDGPNTGRSTLHGSRTPTTTSGRGGGVSPRATTATSPGATKSATATTTTTSSSSPSKLELSDEMAIFLFKRCGARAVGSELAATTNSGNVASGGGEDGRDDLRLSLDMWDKAMQLHRIRLRLPPAPIMEDARQLIASMCAAANNGGGRGVAADNALIDVEIFRTIVEDQFRQASKYVEVGGLRGDARLQPLRPATAPTNSNNNNNTEYALPVFCYPERPPLSLAMVLAAINPSELVKPLRHGEVVRFLRCVGLVDVSLRAIVHQQELAVKQQARGMMMAGSPTRSGNNTNRSTSAAPTTAEELLWGSQAPPRSGSTAITHTEAGEGVVGEMSSSLEEEDRPHPARLARRMQRAKLEHQRAANNRVGRMPDYSYVKSRYQYPSPHLDEISRSVIARAKARRLMQELRTRAIPIHRFEWYARAEAPPDHSEIPTDLMKGHHLLQESESASIADSDALPNLDKLLLPPRNGKQKHHHDARYDHDQAQQDAPRQPRPQHHNPYRGAKTASFLPINNPRCYALSGTQPAARATPSTFERLGRPQCDPRVYSFLLTQPYALESLAAAAKRPATGLRPIGADSPRARDVAEPATLTDEDLHLVYQPHRPRSKGRPGEVRRRRRKLAGQQQQQQQQTSRRTRSSAASSSKQRPQTGGQRAGSPKLRATRTNTPSSTSTTPMHGAAATTAAAPRRPASDCQAASSANNRRPPRRPLTSSSRNNNNTNNNQPGSEEEPMPTVLCSTLEVQQKRRADIYARRIRELQGEFEYRQTLRMEREGKRRGGRTSANATPSAATRTTSSSRGGSHGSLPPRAATDGVDESSSNNPTTSSTPTAGATTASAKKKLGPTRTTPTAAERRQPSMPPLAPRRRPSPSHPTGSFHVRSASASEQHSAASSEPTTPSSIATSPSTNAFVLEKLARAQPSSMDGGGPPRKKALPAAKTAATPPTRATSTKKEAPSTTKKKNIIAKPPTTDTTSTEAESAETSAEPTPFVDDAASPPPPASSTTTAAACADPSPLSEPAYLQHVDSSKHDDDDGAEGEEEQKQPQPQEEEEEGEEHRSQQHSHREFVSYASSDVQSGMISPALVSRRVIDHTQAPTTGDHQSLYYDRGGAVDAEEYDSGLVEEPPAVVLAPTEYEDMYGYEPYNLHNVQQQQHNDEDDDDDDDRGRQEDEKELCSTDSANSFVEAAAAAAAGGGARRSSSPASASHSSAVIPPSPTHEDDPSANNNNNSAFEGRTGRSTPSLEQHVSLLSHASSRTPLSGPRQRPGSRSPHASPRLIFSASGGGGGEAAIGPDWSGTSSAGAAAGRPHGSPMPPMANNNNNNVGEDGRPPRIPT